MWVVCFVCVTITIEEEEVMNLREHRKSCRGRGGRNYINSALMYEILGKKKLGKSQLNKIIP